MKKILFWLPFLLGLSLQAQPDLMNYQTVVRSPQGQPLANQAVGFRFSIRQGSGSGTIVYQETHATQTNDYGLVSLKIGDGSSGSSLGQVDWAGGPYFLQVEVDPAGGSAYEDLGSTQLLSVPYALHAQTAAEVDDADADPSNELQSLSLQDNVLILSQGNSVTLPGASPEATAKAWVNFPIVGTPNLSFDAYNVTNTSVTATGVRVVSFPPGLFSPATNPAMVCQIRNDLAPGFCVVTSGASPSQVTVRTYDASGNLANKEFSLVVFGR
ncbi:MAG: hypothetical protein D6722_13835 [Bacteroidetes bacterium]|nr:MAG: hypothetical protein D6722_13835 [Bacteroidota bacterium]